MKMNIEKWTEAIKANPKDLEAYNKLIEIYRSNGEIEELRNIRLQMKKTFPLSPGLLLLIDLCIATWNEWIEDEQGVASTVEEKESICHLYTAALKDYYSVDLWTHYLTFVSMFLPDRMKTVAEEGISACAADCAESIRVWAVILDWSMKSQAPSETESYFKRMLSHPSQFLDEAYKQYTQWHDQIQTPCDEEMRGVVDKSKEEYKKREILENELSASLEVDHITTAFRHFSEYVEFELQQFKKKENELNRPLALYERFSFQFRTLGDFWHSYFLFVLDFVKLPATALSVSSRALRNVNYLGSLYCDRILALELGGKPIASVTPVYQTAYQTVLSSYYDYLQVFLAVLATYRRRAENKEESAIAVLEDYCSHCVDWLVGLDGMVEW